MWIALRLKSILLFFYIEFLRVKDHAIRMISGLPSLERSEITPHLYLGGQYSPKGYERLSQMGITGIVNMRETPVSKKIKQSSIEVLHLPTKDLHAPPLSMLHKGADFIKDQISKNGKVYVHCRLGEGRGPTMVMAYLMSTGMLYDDALALIKRVRPFIHITKHQQGRLKELQKVLLQEKETLGDVFKTS